jgi:hypothetical protein
MARWHAGKEIGAGRTGASLRCRSGIGCQSGKPERRGQQSRAADRSGEVINLLGSTRKAMDNFLG